MSDRSEDELLRIVGSHRADFSPVEIEAAENELRGRAGSARAHALSRLKTATRLSILFGFVCLVIPLALLQEPMRSGRPEPLPLQLVPWIQSLAGSVIGVGGIGLWRRRAWGARLIVRVLRVGMVVSVAFHVYFVSEAVRGLPPTVGVFFAVVGVIFALLYIAIFQRGVIYLSEPGLLALLDERPNLRAG